MALKLKFNTSEPGFWVSGVAHASLLAAAMIGLSVGSEFPEAQEGIPVEIITDNQLSQITKGETNAKAPQPKPRAERVAESTESNPVPTGETGVIDTILAATLPTDEEMLGHYLQLVAAGESPPVRRAYRTGRDRLNAAVTRVLQTLGVPWSADLIIAVVDGACVSALSEGRDVRQTARHRLRALLYQQ